MYARISKKMVVVFNDEDRHLFCVDHEHDFMSFWKGYNLLCTPDDFRNIKYPVVLKSQGECGGMAGSDFGEMWQVLEYDKAREALGEEMAKCMTRLNKYNARLARINSVKAFFC